MSYKYARHAKPGKMYGEIDLTVENESLELGPEGFAQAKALAVAEQRKPFKSILSSPFKRTLQTAETVHSKQGGTAKLVVVPALKEVNFGQPTREALKSWLATGLSDSGESVSQARSRVRSVLDILRQYSEVHGLIVAHKLLYSIFLLESEGLPDEAPVSALQNNKLLDYAECVQLPEFRYLQDDK